MRYRLSASHAQRFRVLNQLEQVSGMAKKISWTFLFAAAASLLPLSASAQAAAESPRHRLIVLTDIGNEPDDSESMVRLLLYSNDIDIEGFVASTSRHLPNGTHPEKIKRRIDAYAEVLSNLRKHDPHYPDAATLMQRVQSGSAVYGMTGVGKGKDTAASRLIIAAVDRPDPRPIWIAAWGGAADLAQALWTVRSTRSPAQVAKFVSKLRVYTISDQDDAGPWARAYFPELFWVTSVHAFTQYGLATWTGISAPYRGSDTTATSNGWLHENIIGKGPLGALYPPPAYLVEGDTPSFLSLISNGLNFPERPDWGGWGGRYGKVSESLGLWASTQDSVPGGDLSPQATIWRWRTAFQNDFLARMNWTVTPDYRNANHPPLAMINGAPVQNPVLIDACPGAPVTLFAEGSSDPDGNSLSYKWTWYREATGLHSPNLTLSSDSEPKTTATIDATANVDQFSPPASYQLHVILTVTDNGSPNLVSYRRAIITVKGAGQHGATKPCAVTAIGPKHKDYD
jgi:Protein of unknown function (DUF1593)